MIFNIMISKDIMEILSPNSVLENLKKKKEIHSLMYSANKEVKENMLRKDLSKS